MAHRLIFTNNKPANLHGKYVVGSGVGSRNRSVYRALQNRASNNAAGQPCCIEQAQSQPSCVQTSCTGGTFSDNTTLERLRGCTDIVGNVILINFTGQIDFTVFDCLQTISGNFNIQLNPALTSISGFANLQTIGGEFDIVNNANLANISGFGSLTALTGITGLANITGVVNIILCQTTDTRIGQAVNPAGDYTKINVTIILC